MREAVYDTIIAWTVTFCSGFGVLLEKKIKKYIEKKPRPKLRSNNGLSPKIKLNSANGIGVMLLGGFEYNSPDSLQKILICYPFIPFLFLPLIPLGCYICYPGEEKYINYKHSTQNLYFYGSQPWRFIEILHIYLSGFSGTIFRIGLIFCIIGTIDLFCI